MNATDPIKPATKPISLAHEVLLKADDALCAEEIACAILGVDKPSKIDIKSVTKQLKQLADLGMIEMEPRAGGVPFYRLIAAPVAESAESGRADIPTKTYPPAVIKAMVAELSGDSEGGEADTPATFLAPDDYEMPPADPALLASANRMLCERMEGIAEAIRASTIPALEGVTGAEDLAPHVKTLCDSLGAAEIVATGRGHTIDGLRLEVEDLRDRLDAQIKQWQADTGRLAADLRAATEARSHAINEADRLRTELAIERQARKVLQEQGNATDMTAAAVGYLVRVTKRPPMIRRKLEAARLAALGAVRAGAARADVLAVVSVGVARRGAEWREA